MANLVTKEDIAAKRQEVNRLYEEFGFHSNQYCQAYDELHAMNMDFMTNQYRKERGLPPTAITPYCPNQPKGGAHGGHH